MHNRFFTPPENIKDKKITIVDKKEIHHIIDVLRQGMGSKIFIFDGKGNEYAGTIQEILKEKISIIIDKKMEIKNKPYQITLACAIPKKAKFDFIVEKATELGVDKIIPLETERTEVKIDKEKMLLKVNHWQQIAINASEQSQRSLIPQHDQVRQFNEVITEVNKYDLAIMPTLEGDRISISDVLSGFKGKSIIVFIGPEGDFSLEEVASAKKLGCKLVTLGENVLKVDTAAISVVAILNYILESKR